jgi:hypothetical protein
MTLEFSTPALLFPAITLLMLAYTNRFLSLASLVRKLHTQYVANSNADLATQIKSLRSRLVLIKYMQLLGVLSFTLCIITMYVIYTGNNNFATVLFALGLLALLGSSILAIIEIWLSTKAIEVELSDMEHGQNENSIINYIKNKFD